MSDAHMICMAKTMKSYPVDKMHCILDPLLADSARFIVVLLDAWFVFTI